MGIISQPMSERSTPASHQKLPSPRQFSGIPSTISVDELDYCEDALIDTGNFGSVYYGKVRELPVAIKVLKDATLTPKAMETFQREVDIVRNNAHPNIVRYLGVCAEPGNFIIIMEFIPGGNLQQLLEDDRKVSLFSLLVIAKDVALGMNWLHLAKPQIIHRDLKLTNVLLDENQSAKICDFGLSQEKFSPFLRDPSTGAKGTPLWMAPEVLRLEPFNEKCDVYSFGILLWCLITRKEPFEEFTEFEPFFKAVCYEDVRPPIPNDCPTRLENLIKVCWAPSPKSRPSFTDVIQELYHILIEIAIEDPDGREFWDQNCLDRTSIYWDDFIELFLEQYVYLPDDPTPEEIARAKPFQLSEFSARNLKNVSIVSAEWKKRYGSPQPPDNIAQLERELDIQSECAKVILAHNGPGDVDMVSMETFGNMLKWFGPICGKDRKVELFDRIKEFLEHPAFHGDVSAPQAQRIMPKTPGAYMIRFSSLAGQYAITYITQDQKVAHSRISYNVDHGFYYKNQYYPKLQDLITALTPGLGLTVPCPGSKYQIIFTRDPEVSSYSYIS